MKKSATLEAIARRERRALRAMGAPTRREIADQQAAEARWFRQEGRIAEIAAEQADELAAARRVAGERIAAALADVAAETAAVAAVVVVAGELDAAEQTLEDVARAGSNLQIRFRVWRSSRETRVYVQCWNGSRARPWTDRGYYRIDEAARSVDRSQVDRRGPVEAFEAALAAFLG